MCDSRAGKEDDNILDILHIVRYGGEPLSFSVSVSYIQETGEHTSKQEWALSLPSSTNFLTFNAENH